MADSDCTAGSICREGRCVDSKGDGDSAGRSAASAGHAPADPVFDLATLPRIGKGPTQAPKVAWEHELGAVVFAAPVIVSATEGASGPLGPGVDPERDLAVAYVGDHAGRFVGVVVDGPRAGEMVVDFFVQGMVWRRAAWDQAGHLYFGADDDQLYKLSLESGELEWTLRLGNCEPPRAPGPEGVRCDVDGGPTIGPDGELYVGADGLYRVSPDGTIRWRSPARSDEPYASHVYSIPLVTDEGLVIYGGYDGTLRALATGDGTERWQVPIGADVDGSPVEGPDGTIYVGADDGKLYAIAASDGMVLWTHDAKRDVRAGIAVAEDGTLLQPSFDGNLYAVAPSGTTRWILPTGAAIGATPSLDAVGTIFVGSRDDRLYAIASEGRVLWNVAFPADVDSGVAISPVGTLVVGCDDGVLRALR